MPSENIVISESAFFAPRSTPSTQKVPTSAQVMPYGKHFEAFRSSVASVLMQQTQTAKSRFDCAGVYGSHMRPSQNESKTESEFVFSHTPRGVTPEAILGCLSVAFGGPGGFLWVPWATLGDPPLFETPPFLFPRAFWTLWVLVCRLCVNISDNVC